MILSAGPRPLPASVRSLQADDKERTRKRKLAAEEASNKEARIDSAPPPNPLNMMNPQMVQMLLNASQSLPLAGIITSLYKLHCVGI